MKNNIKYPFQNRSIKNIKGERWKDIPGFEGYYKASNLGRIKSLDRIINHPRLGTQTIKGRILSQSISKNLNIKTGKPMIDLRACLAMDGSMYYYNTRRLIFMTFVKRIDYYNDGMYVINKDGNGYNNSVSNLKLVTKSEKSQRIFQRDRIDSYLKIADRSKWKKNYGGYSRSIPVKQYDKKGKLIKQYESIQEASRKTGCGPKEISYVARGIFRQSKGFKWKFVKRTKGNKK